MPLDSSSVLYPVAVVAPSCNLPATLLVPVPLTVRLPAVDKLPANDAAFVVLSPVKKSEPTELLKMEMLPAALYNM